MLFHTARVLCLAWSADSLRIVSGSIDTNLCVWNATKGERTQMIKGKLQRLLIQCHACYIITTILPLTIN